MYSNKQIIKGHYKQWRYTMPLKERQTKQQIEEEVALFMDAAGTQEDAEGTPKKSE